MIAQGQTLIFKESLYQVFLSHTYYIALYDAYAALGPQTLGYTSLNEVTGPGYTAGGEMLIGTQVGGSDQTAYVSWANPSWSGASFTCRGALIYDATSSIAVAVLDFGSDKTANGTFTLTLPPFTPTTALIRSGT